MAVLLLNASMQPLNVISHRRLVVLLSKERVDFVHSGQRAAVEAAVSKRELPDGVFMVRLLANIRIPRRLLRPNRRNLLLRDDNTCQYCGFVGHASELTVDHVLPVSRGGPAAKWENLVIACKKCNWRKANKKPEEANMHLRRRPLPLTQEYAHILFLRYPELKAAYDTLLKAA